MTLTQSDSASSTIRSIDQIGFAINVTESLRSDSITNTITTLADQANILVNTSAATWKDYTFSIEGGKGFSISVVDGNAIISGNTVSRSSSNSATVSLAIDGQKDRPVFCLNLNIREGSGYSRFDSFISGSSSLNLTESITSLLIDGKQLNYFSTINHSSGIYIKNPNCWLYGKDLSPFAVASYIGGAWTLQRGGALITPQHAEEATHFPTAIGEKKRWLKTDGSVVEKTVIGAATYGDIRVLTLESGVSGIAPIPIVGSWFAPTISTETFGGASIHNCYDGALGACFQQGRICGVLQLGLAPSLLSRYSAIPASVNGQFFPSMRQTVTFWKNELDPYLEGKSDFLIDLIEGDSGSPCILFPDGNPALYSHFHYTTGGPHLEESVLNALIASADANAGISTGYTVTVAPDPTL